MSQTKLGSWTETITNTTVGFAINYVANLLILPMFVVGLTYSGAFWMGIIFTVISVIRSYIMRRIFNRIKAKWNTVADESAPAPSERVVELYSMDGKCKCKHVRTLKFDSCLECYVCNSCGRVSDA